MTTYTLVRPEHLNHFGHLFGGQLLLWVDEFAWLAATREFPGCTFVTRAMDEVAFQHQVTNGAILEFNINLARRGRTSVTYTVSVDTQPAGQAETQTVFSTRVTFVNVAADGSKTALV
jgi:acyl-CoA hydrolase